VSTDDDSGAREARQQLDLLKSNPKSRPVHTGGLSSTERAPRRGQPLAFASQPSRRAFFWASLREQDHSQCRCPTRMLRQVGVFNPAYFGSGDWRVVRIGAYDVGFVEPHSTMYASTGERHHSSRESGRTTRCYGVDRTRLKTSRTRFDATDLRQAKAFNQAGSERPNPYGDPPWSRGV